ncbi:FMN-binding negative transcriptional regulator [Stappia sp. 28M-7]|uniref:FMN-binding negative transcriptional regulator n=1 Tax=Stappia sp. 28M-7 TaxID=2762596 RepID=UPI00163D158C|nr:FMN-binding negative transcriptional regulator [Stappia sp. 28M-7]MBC2858362.1 FMN-binding negative transcriptional regulator [Stappia sp. 28M-7]
MYTPPAFREDDPAALAAMIGACPLATLVTATADGLLATPLPLLFDPAEGPFGVLHGHLARANPQWRAPVLGEALATFSGPDAYVSPGWYASKAEHGKVVPTWNYAAVHAYGKIEFFEDADRLLHVVARLTDRHEAGRTDAWAVSDAPADFVAAQLRGIVGMRMVITRLEGKRKMSQNRSAADRAGVAQGLAGEGDERARRVAGEIPL